MISARTESVARVRDLDARDLERRLADLGPRRVCELLQIGATPQDGYVIVTCPWHADRTPSASVTIGDNGTIRVRCFACDATRDVHALVAAVHRLDVEEDFVAVLRVEDQLLTVSEHQQTATQKSASMRTMEKAFPDAIELGQLWRACIPVDLIDHDDPVDQVAVCEFLRARGIDPEIVRNLDVARRLPQVGTARYPDWLPTRWVWNYRLALLGYDATGIPRSIHVRAVRSTDNFPKSLWPEGCRSTGLVFANDAARRVLKSPTRRPPHIMFVEGVPDFLATCAWTVTMPELAGTAVFGVGSWSRTLFPQVAWPQEVPYSILTHADEAGRKYASAIVHALPGNASARVIDLGALAGSSEKVDCDQASPEVRAKALGVQFDTVDQLRGANAPTLPGQRVAQLKQERKAALCRGRRAWLDTIEGHLRGAPLEMRDTIMWSSIGALLRHGVDPTSVAEFVSLATGLSVPEFAKLQRRVEEWMAR